MSGPTYQVNIYYGIHYPAEIVDRVVEALNASAFHDLALDEEYERDGAEFMRNVNSESEESRGIIIADNLTITGADSETPAAFCNFDPAELMAAEEREHASVEICTDIYDSIVAHFKKSKYSLLELRQGWGAYNCEWLGDDSGEESSEEKPVKPARAAKPTTAKVAKPTTAKTAKPTVAKTANRK